MRREQIAARLLAAHIANPGSDVPEQRSAELTEWEGSAIAWAVAMAQRVMKESEGYEGDDE